MEDQFKHQLLQEATRIGDELLKIARRDENGMSWSIVAVEQDNSTTTVQMEYITSGVCGAVLFFLELHRQTRQERFMEAAVEGIRWVEHYCLTNPSEFYSFLTGRMGVAYTLRQMHRATGDPGYLVQALEIASGSLDFFNDFRLVSNWNNGVSGTLVALLHLHAATGEKWLLEKIDSFIEYLVRQTWTGPKGGIYWDRSSQNVTGLCGFANGASGIGFAFLELGRYFGNPSFYWMARQAFIYESTYYDPHLQNWPDFRKERAKYEDYSAHEDAYLSGDMSFFTTGRDTDDWSYGASGIGLCRLRALELLEDRVYEQEARDAILRAIQTEIDTSAPPPSMYILNDGSGGRAELFLKAADVLNESQYRDHAETIARRALAYKENYGKYRAGMRYDGPEGDSSLFMGTPGIGYFYLRVLDSHHAPSILMPQLDESPVKRSAVKSFKNISISLPGIKEMVLEHRFPRTLAVGHRLFSRRLGEFFGRESENKAMPLKDSFKLFTRDIIPSLTGTAQTCFADVAVVEVEKLHLDDVVPSHNLLFIKDRFRRREIERWQEVELSQLRELTLVRDEDHKMHYTQWNWDLSADADSWIANLNREPGQFFSIFRNTPMGVVENLVSPFVYVIVSRFEPAVVVNDAMPRILETFGDIPPGDGDMVTKQILHQIRELIKAGILRVLE